MPHLTFKKLIDLAKKLRSPIGCPWDREQTIGSMLEHIAEESEEVRNAIQKKDYHNLKEELGDLLFLIVMVSQIAKENDLFSIKDVLDHIQNKIISRHTWVFGKDKAKTAKEAIKLWQKNKKNENRR